MSSDTPAKSKRASTKGGGGRRSTSVYGMAAAANVHGLYERAVQDTQGAIEALDDVFLRLKGRRALSLREDFCGTALLCADWVRSFEGRSAVGVDLDAETLDYGRRVHLAGLDDAQQGRVQLLEANVLEGAGPKTDVVVALNFSYWILSDRATLLRYFKTVRSRLNRDGMFWIDVYGGPESTGTKQDRRTIQRGVKYVWDQAEFDPMTHRTQCYIHFEFSDGSRLDRAYSYCWRVWTMPELRDLLLEAGFSRVRPLWAKTDAKGVELNDFHEVDHFPEDPSWWTYIAVEP